MSQPKVIENEKSFLKLQNLCLRFIGLSIFGKVNRFEQMRTIVNWILLFTALFPEAHYIIVYSKDVILATDALGPFFIIIITLVKILTMHFKRNQFVLLIEKLKELWLQVTDEEKRILESAEKLNKLCTRGMLSVGLVTGTFYVIYPTALGLYETYNYGKAEWTLPTKSLFYIDISYTPVYELVYIWYANGAYLILSGLAGCDCLFFGIAQNVCGHFQIIRQQFETIKLSEMYQGKIRMSREFRKLIIYHNEIVELTNDLDSIYLELIMVTFLISSILLCVLSFQLVLVLGDVKMILYIAFMNMVLLELSIYCYSATQIMHESGLVLDGIYSSEWYSVTPEIRRSVFYCMLRASKHNEINGGFYSPSLPTLTSIISAAASYVTILQSFLTQ